MWSARLCATIARLTLVTLTNVRLELQSQNPVDISYGKTFGLGA